MHRFLTANRSELIARCRTKVAQRAPPGVPEEELAHGVTEFLEQVIKTLQMETTSDPMRSRKVSGPSGGGEPVLSEIGESASQHGKELFRARFHRRGSRARLWRPLPVDHRPGLRAGCADQHRRVPHLNRCLDNAIANAVTEFGYQRDFAVADRQAEALNERLGFFAHELRNLLCTATLALSIIKEGKVGLTGATGDVLDRALVGLGNLIDRSLAEVRMTAGMSVHNRQFSLAEFIAEIKLSASLEAQVRGCVLSVSEVDPLLAVDADRDLLLSAAGNLLQNAFKFSHPRAEITLNAYAAADRVLIDVEDQCGGLAPGSAETMFVPFTQASANKSGLGLGLSISRRSVEANGGVFRVRNIPGSGCVFTIDLPRRSLAESDAVAGVA